MAARGVVNLERMGKRNNGRGETLAPGIKNAQSLLGMGSITA
jgi:hypothetical protein